MVLHFTPCSALLLVVASSDLIEYASGCFFCIITTKEHRLPGSKIVISAAGDITPAYPDDIKSEHCDLDQLPS